MPERLDQLQREQWEFAKATFPGETWEDVLHHLMHELESEVDHAQDDPEEYADCLLLLLCLASHRGIDLDKAVRAKFEKVKKRKWKVVPGLGYRHV